MRPLVRMRVEARRVPGPGAGTRGLGGAERGREPRRAGFFRELLPQAPVAGSLPSLEFGEEGVSSAPGGDQSRGLCGLETRDPPLGRVLRAHERGTGTGAAPAGLAGGEATQALKGRALQPWGQQQCLLLSLDAGPRPRWQGLLGPWSVGPDAAPLEQGPGAVRRTRSPVVKACDKVAMSGGQTRSPCSVGLFRTPAGPGH